MKIKDIYDELYSMKTRSAWSEGVKNYAIYLLDAAYGYCSEEIVEGNLHEELLNGAENWKEYSYGGCALIYDGDIAEALCTPSELVRTKGGRLAPNSRESWLDVQARALYEAEGLILSAAAQLAEEGRKTA